MIRRNTYRGLRARKPLLLRSYCPIMKIAGRSWRLFRSVGPEKEGTLRAGTNGAEIIEAVDSRGMAIVKVNLQSVVAHRMRGLGGEPRLEHRQERRTQGKSGRAWIFTSQLRIFFKAGLFLLPLVIAHGAGALLAQVGEIEMADVFVGPCDIHTSAGRNVDFYLGRFSARIDGNRHECLYSILCDGGSYNPGQAAVFEFHAAVGQISDGL